MTREEQQAALLRVRIVLQHLKEINQESLTETEQEALTDVIGSASERAQYFFWQAGGSSRGTDTPTREQCERKEHSR